MDKINKKEGKNMMSLGMIRNKYGCVVSIENGKIIL